MRHLTLIGLLFIPSLMSLMDISEETLLPSPSNNKVLYVPFSDLKQNMQGQLIYEKEPYSGYAIKDDIHNTILEKARYENGLLHGDVIGYYSNGNVKQIRPYVNGQKHGLHIGWYANGNIRFHYSFENGLGMDNHKEWYENGAPMMDLNYKNGKQFGAQKMWRKDGKLRSNYVVRENGRRYGLMGIKRCTKLDGDEEKIDPYTGE